MADEKFVITRTVDASPEQLFALLTDPARHAEMDSAGMLRNAEGDTRLGGVGDAFVIDMNNQVLGDYLEPADSGTKVTQVYDWSGVADEKFKGFCPMLTAEQLGESIEKAGRAAG